MTIARHSCVTAVCDSCGDGWEDGPWHFGSAAEALNYLRRGEWLVTDGLLLCPDCALRADCEATGHQYSEWRPAVMEGVPFQERSCGHCCRAEYDPPFAQLSNLLHVARTVNQLDTNPDRKGGPI
jgi:hypothetical protein